MKDNLFVHLLSVGLCIAAVTSCGKKPITADFGPAEHEVSVEPSGDTLRLSEYFDSAQVVNLSGCMVAAVYGAVPLGDNYALYGKFYTGEGDSRTESAVALFTRSGEFVRHISIKGRSGKEAVNVSAIKYNPYRDALDVLSDDGQKILGYDTQTWDVKYTVKISDTGVRVANNMIAIDADRYLLYKNLSYALMKKEYKLYLLNATSGEVEGQYLDLDKKRAEVIAFGQSNNLSEDDGKIIFYECFMDTFFTFSGGELHPFIKFAENKYSMTETQLGAKYHDLSDFLDMCYSSGKIWSFRNFYFVGDKAYSQFMIGKDKKYYNVLDLDQNTSHSYSLVKDDLVSGLVFHPKDNLPILAGTEGDTLIASVDTYIYETLANPDSGNNLEESSKGNDEDINPKLLILRQR